MEQKTNVGVFSVGASQALASGFLVNFLPEHMVICFVW